MTACPDCRLFTSPRRSVLSDQEETLHSHEGAPSHCPKSFLLSSSSSAASALLVHHDEYYPCFHACDLFTICFHTNIHTSSKSSEL